MSFRKWCWIVVFFTSVFVNEQGTKSNILYYRLRAAAAASSGWTAGKYMWNRAPRLPPAGAARNLWYRNASSLRLEELLTGFVSFSTPIVDHRCGTLLLLPDNPTTAVKAIIVDQETK